MPLKMPAQNIKVVRDGQPVWPEIGKPFDFTDDEISEIEEANPEALMPVNVREAREIVAAVDGDKDDGKPKPRGGKGKKEDLDDL